MTLATLRRRPPRTLAALVAIGLLAGQASAVRCAPIEDGHPGGDRGVAGEHANVSDAHGTMPVDPGPLAGTYPAGAAEGAMHGGPQHSAPDGHEDGGPPHSPLDGHGDDGGHDAPRCDLVMGCGAPAATEAPHEPSVDARLGMPPAEDPFRAPAARAPEHDVPPPRRV